MNAPAPWIETKAAPLVSEALAHFALDLTPERLPAAVRARAKHLMLDATGIALASTGFEFAHRALSALAGLAGAGEVPVIGMPASLPMRDAALLNGILVHGLDYDDTHITGVVHATAGLFPTVLAVAAARHLPGSAALAAYVAGVEAAARIGAVAKGGFHQIGFHPTGLVGAFGTTLAAGKLFGLTHEQLVNAQGITLSAAAGSLEFLEDGAWTKRFHPGWAANVGITAAALAQQGFVGPRRAYEGRFGLYRSYLQERFDPADLALATVGLGDDWEVLQVAVKPYPACHFVHACVDAALALRAAHGLAPGDIERVEALLPAEGVKIVCEPVANKKRPKNSYDAQFSIPYIVAAAFHRGRFTLAELTEETLADPQILTFADRVDYRIDPNSGFPKYYSGELVVTTRDGRRLSHREHINRGCGDRPLSEAEIIAKFEANAGRAMAPQRARAIRDAVLGIEEAPDMMALARALGGR
ncbi:MAG TPA: MmgE/PrpD family protein [Stellaceae bacterium]|nr:MmgE/PrpD family protein [Stellaceae bacterium]